MYCIKCGNKIEDGTELCSICSGEGWETSNNKLTIKQEKSSRSDFLTFLNIVFKSLFKIALIILVIGSAIAGVAIAELNRNSGFIGFIFGLIVGLLATALLGGLIATILKIEENTARNEELLVRIATSLERMNKE